jgi:hypothetical protein
MNMLKFRRYSLQNILREYTGSGLMNMDMNTETKRNPSAQERGWRENSRKRAQASLNLFLPELVIALKHVIIMRTERTYLGAVPPILNGIIARRIKKMDFKRRSAYIPFSL